MSASDTETELAFENLEFCLDFCLKDTTMYYFIISAMNLEKGKDNEKGER